MLEFAFTAERIPSHVCHVLGGGIFKLHTEKKQIVFSDKIQLFKQFTW